LPAKITMSVPRGALIIHEQAGAGGHGDPITRDPQLVLEDLGDGKITAAFAREHHAVVVAGDGMLDVSGTERLRAARPAMAEGARHGV
jgi:N-methylhydantoinase B